VKIDHKGGNSQKIAVYGPEDIVEISRDEVPKTVMNSFQFEARQYYDPEGEAPAFKRYMLLKQLGGCVTFFTEYDVSYDYDDDRYSERLIYASDLNEYGWVVGSGEVRYSLTDKSPYFLNKPYVSNTLTSANFLRKGYGRRRLIAMNAASLLVHDLVLHSDSNRSAEATAVWQSLAAVGLAEEYLEPAHSPLRPASTRYKFIR
jgi:hypothetical protein